jgi:hypothetical protein
MFDYLQFAISGFESVCQQNLSDRTDFTQEEYNFTGDGETQEFELSPDSPDDTQFYITLNGAQTEEYEYDDETFTVTFDHIPSVGVEIYIVAYCIGTFDVSLSLKEKIILATGMTVPFVRSQTYLTTLLKQMASGGSYKIYSQANHIQANITAIKQAQNDFDVLVCNYSYLNDNDDYIGLVGDPS